MIEEDKSAQSQPVTAQTSLATSGSEPSAAEPLRLRKWFTHADEVTIRLTRRPDDTDMTIINRAVFAFLKTLDEAALARADSRQ